LRGDRSGLARVHSVGRFDRSLCTRRPVRGHAGAFRPDPDVVQRLPIGYAVQALGFWAVAVTYAKTSPRSSSILGGIRFGLRIGAIVLSLAVVCNYVTQPISVAVGVAEALEYMFLSAIYGAIIDVIYRAIVTVGDRTPLGSSQAI
jgi:hypothetical protein